MFWIIPMNHFNFVFLFEKIEKHRQKKTSDQFILLALLALIEH